MTENLNRTDANYCSSKRGQPHGALPAIRTGYFYIVAGQEVFEWILTSPVNLVSPRGALGIVETHQPGLRFWE